MPQQRGFVLVELIVGIIIISVIAGGFVLWRKAPVSNPPNFRAETPSHLVPTESLTPTITEIPTPTQIPTSTPIPLTNTPKPQIPTSTPIPPTPTQIPSTPIPPTNTPIPSCTHNTNPVFTHDITDISKVNYIVAPPTIGAGPSLKTHSYIGTDHALVPIYAPIAMKLVSGAYFVGGPYALEFQVSCEVSIRFGHVTNPIDAVKAVLPTEPASDSRTYEVTPVSFNAGDLIAYTTGTDLAGNWDFGVYNSATTNRYVNDPTWNISTTYTTAVCPFQYFVSNLKSVYYALFNNNVLGGNPPDGESFCQ